MFPNFEWCEEAEKEARRAAPFLSDLACLSVAAWLAFALSGCGGGWRDQDTKAAQDALRAQQTLLRYCEDGSPACGPDTVRAVERATTCNLGSMLARHGAVADAGSCAP